MLALDSLYRHCIFRSEERSETHALVAEELCDHRLKWQGGAVDTRLYKFNARQLALYSLRYGDAVGIHPEVYSDFSLVHFSLSGGIEVEADGRRHDVKQGRAIISSPSRDIRLNWSRACEQLILRVPHEAFAEAARRLGQERLRGSLKAIPGLPLDAACSRQWQLQLQAFAALEAQAGSDPAYLPWLAHVEQGLIMFLLLQYPGGAAGAGAGGGSGSARIGGHVARRLERLHEFADAHLTMPVALGDLARAAALSERQLNALCHEHFGVPPMVWLRQLRLDAIRRLLQHEPRTDVSAAAMLHGFSHLGRFAGYYRLRFGELPSETIKSARSGQGPAA